MNLSAATCLGSVVGIVDAMFRVVGIVAAVVVVVVVLQAAVVGELSPTTSALVLNATIGETR